MLKLRLSEDILRGTIDNYLQIRLLAAQFVRSLHPKSNVDEEEISLDNGGIHWQYEENISCHCHPDMVTKRHDYQLDKFMDWYYINEDK